MNADEIFAKKRLKSWNELAPFYLDFSESIQFHFLINDLQWAKPVLEPKENGHFELLLLISGQLEQNSFITSAAVIYPNETALVNPEDLVRFEREIISFAAHENKIRQAHKLQILSGIEDNRV